MRSHVLDRLSPKLSPAVSRSTGCDFRNLKIPLLQISQLWDGLIEDYERQ